MWRISGTKQLWKLPNFRAHSSAEIWNGVYQHCLLLIGKQLDFTISQTQHSNREQGLKKEIKQLKNPKRILGPGTRQKDITGLCHHPPGNNVPNKMLPPTRLISCALTTAKQLVFSVVVIKENNTCKMASPGLKPGNFSVISITCCFSLSLTCLKRGKKRKQTQGRC